MSNVKLIKEQLLQQIVEVCRFLLPRGYNDGTNWRVGSVKGEPGNSLSVCLIGDHKGLWRDWAGSDEDHGDILNLWMKVRGLPFLDAVEESEIWLESHAPYLPAPLFPDEIPEAEKPTYFPSRMPRDLSNMWFEGLNFLDNNPGIQYALDESRGWPEGTTEALCRMEQIACIHFNGRPHWAFRVVYPTAIGTVTVGFHARPIEQLPGEKTPWFYRPNQKQDGAGIPCVPFVLEGGVEEVSGLIVITEGQWDAVTFASVAGWLNKWPELATVLGLRGAKSWKTFLHHWGKYLPKADFLLIPDHDEAGLQWRDEFATALRSRARSVHFMIPPQGLDFSEWHAREPLTASFIKEYLRSLNLAPTR